MFPGSGGEIALFYSFTELRQSLSPQPTLHRPSHPTPVTIRSRSTTSGQIVIVSLSTEGYVLHAPSWTTRGRESIPFPVWGPDSKGRNMIVFSMTFTYDGQVLRGSSQASAAGVQDLGLPAHACKRGLRVGAGDGYELAFSIAEQAEQFAEDLLLDAKRLKCELDQLVFPAFTSDGTEPMDVRSLRRELLGRRRAQR
jgi:hypothetical protein